MQDEVKTVTVSSLRRQLSVCVSHVLHTRGRIQIKRNGRRVAALVTIGDLVALEESDLERERQERSQRDARWERFERVKKGLD